MSKGKNRSTMWDVKKEVPTGYWANYFSVSDGEVNWIHTALLTASPVLALLGFLIISPRYETLLFWVVLHFWTGFGITAGYHRLWSHRAYTASFPVRLFLLFGATGAAEGTAKWWCQNHRSHHRYTDTDKDPYNAKRGLWVLYPPTTLFTPYIQYSHLGWLLVKQNVKKIGYSDISDLERDPMLRFQHDYYLPCTLFAAVIFPTLVCGLLWDDYLGGFFYAVWARIVLAHHCTFIVNSLSHWIGDKPFSDHHTSVDSQVLAMMSLGEGYHNYHHEFPEDYRNGRKLWHYDPTKWFIWGLSLVGLTYNLKRISDGEVQKAVIQMRQRRIDEEKTKIRLGKNFDDLPIMTWSEIQDKVSDGRCLVVIDDIVHDVQSFAHEHPGGRLTLLNWIGKDVTRLFGGLDGSEHEHSKEARKFLQAMRVAKLQLVK